MKRGGLKTYKQEKQIILHSIMNETIISILCNFFIAVIFRYVAGDNLTIADFSILGRDFLKKV